MQNVGIQTQNSIIIILFYFFEQEENPVIIIIFFLRNGNPVIVINIIDQLKTIALHIFNHRLKTYNFFDGI